MGSDGFPSGALRIYGNMVGTFKETFCERCKERIRNGEKVITNIGSHRRPRSKTWHQECYVDAKGRPMIG